MSLEKLTLKQKDEFYWNLVRETKNSSCLRVPEKKYFFGDYDPLKKPSFFKRLYYTLF